MQPPVFLIVDPPRALRSISWQRFAEELTRFGAAEVILSESDGGVILDEQGEPLTLFDINPERVLQLWHAFYRRNDDGDA